MDDRTFDAAAHMRKIRTRQGMQDYLDVKWRVAWVRAEHPDAQIITEQVEADEQHARFKCVINIPGGAIGTGHGSETAQDFPDFYEKAETKAIGRACAILGYGTDAAIDFDDGVPMDGAGAAKGEPDRKLEPRERAAVDEQHARNTTPPPMRLPATRTHGAQPLAGTGVVSVARQHGITRMEQVLPYLHAHNFTATNKGQAITELETVFKERITPAHGKTEEDGRPVIFPSDIYDFAHYHITRTEAEESLSDEQMRAEMAQESLIGTGR